MIDMMHKFTKDFYMFSGDVNDLIGKPYADGGGDGINSFDCGSLVRYITGIDVHFVPSCKMGDIRAIVKAIEKNKRHFNILKEPKEKCIVSLSRLNKPHHVGVYIKGGVLHATEGVGVVFSSFQNLKDNGFTWEFGEFING